MPYIQPHATIQTWGTRKFGSNGMLHYLDVDLFGGNVGHAAITLQFPANDTGKKLINAYCKKKDGTTVIPYEIKTFTAPDGKIEVYYSIRFSWWPSTIAGESYLSSQEEDQIEERLGVHVNYREKFKKFAEDTRIYRGKLGQQIKALSPLGIAHVGRLQNDPDHQYIAKQKIKNAKLKKDIESMNLLIYKLKENIAWLNEKSYNNVTALPSTSNPPSDLTQKIKLNTSRLLMLENLLPKETYNGLVETILGQQAIFDDAQNNLANAKLGLNEINQIINIVKKHRKKLRKKQRKTKELLSSIQKIEKKIAEQPEIISDLIKINTVLQQKIANNETIRLEDKIFPSSNQKPTTYRDFFDKNLPNWKYPIKQNSKKTIPDTLTTKELALLLEYSHAIFNLHNIKEHLTLGSPPDDQIVLPIHSPSKAAPGLQNGLELEAMLQRMRDLIYTGFSLKDKNCSETVGQILEAGCTEPGLKQIANTRALGAFGNPQEVVNKAARIQTHLYHHTKPNIIERLNNFSPITKLNGALLKILVNEETSPKRIMAGIAMIPMGTLAIGSFLIRGIFNPLKVFNDCSAIIDFAFSHKSRLLKLAIPITVGPIATIFAIPAAMQYGIKNATQYGIKKLVTSYKQSKSSYVFSLEQTQLEHDLIEKEEEIASFVRNNEQGIEKKSTPEATLQAFIQALFDNKNTIPYFTNTAIKQISAAIEVTNKNDNKPLEIINAIANYAQQLQDENPEKFARLKLPAPKDFKKMSVQNIYKTLCDCSLARANSAILRDKALQAKREALENEVAQAKKDTKAKIKNRVLRETKKGKFFPSSNEQKHKSEQPEILPQRNKPIDRDLP